MQHAATSASKLQVLYLDMIGLPRKECLLECLIFITLVPTFDQVAHLEIRYANINRQAPTPHFGSALLDPARNSA